MSESFSFPLRVVQLDLARQMETVDFIREFTDFAADNGFNALGLYLEGRVRTASFPWPSEEESYSPAEVREIVAHAARRGVEVIPVVSTLGHAAMFLQYPELAGLAETRPPFTGRFGPGGPKVFCPSLPGTYDFLRRYLAEIGELFPSHYFHVGCDETWDLRRCDLCRERGSEAEIFRDHLLAVHEIVTGTMGKRAIFWDDMLFQYSEIFGQLPRDMIPACWQYQGRVDPPRGHFLHREALDMPGAYERLGFEYLVCPADSTLENAESFTAYAARHRPLGGWLTAWEKHEITMMPSFPLLGAVGRLWASGCAPGSLEPLRETVTSFFGIEDAVFFEAVRALCRSGHYRDRSSTPASFLTARGNNSDYAREGLTALLLAVLPPYLEKVRPSSRIALEEMLLSLESEQVAGELLRVYPRIFCGGGAEPVAELDILTARIESLFARRRALHGRVRAGLSLDAVDALYETYLADLRSLLSRAATHGFLRAGFCLPDQYAAATTRLAVLYEGEAAAVPVAQGVFKSMPSFDAHYSRLFAIERDRVPREVIVETWGYGEQGFTWFEAHNAHGRFVPGSVEAEAGRVSHPEWILRDDWKAVFAGEPDARISFFDEAAATAIHRFRVTLVPAGAVPHADHLPASCA